MRLDALLTDHDRKKIRVANLLTDLSNEILAGSLFVFIEVDAVPSIL